MTVFYYFYIRITLLTQLATVVLSSENLENMELVYLSRQLNPTECLRFLEAMYLKKPITDYENDGLEAKVPFESESLLHRQLERPFLSRKNCRLKLGQWIRNLPEKSSRCTRAAMETVLQILGRPDMAQYIRRNRRIAQYLDEFSGNPKHSVKHPISSRPIISKVSRVSPTGRKFKNPPKEAVVQIYRNSESSKATKGNSIYNNRGEVNGAHSVEAKRIEDDNSGTRWIGFLVLLAIIALTVLATLLFALYKKNRGSLFPNGEKVCDDRCPLSDGTDRKSWTSDVDLEQGTSCPPCGRRKKRDSLTEEPSPSSIYVRKNMTPTRKPTRKKYVKDKQQKLENRRKRRCDKQCTGLMQKKPNAVLKFEKSTITQERTISEKNQPVRSHKPSLNLQKFHEKIANILRKDVPPCKCCKCCKCKLFLQEDNGHQNVPSNYVTELHLNPTESPKRSGEEDENRKKTKEKSRKREKHHKKYTGKGKESEQTSPENSARTKNKWELKIKEKNMKKGRRNIKETCDRKSCHFRQPTVENTLNTDDDV